MKDNLDVGQVVHRCIHFVSSGWEEELCGRGQPHSVWLFCLENKTKSVVILFSVYKSSDLRYHLHPVSVFSDQNQSKLKSF